jgi:hypothetical protein
VQIADSDSMERQTEDPTGHRPLFQKDGDDMAQAHAHLLAI